MKSPGPPSVPHERSSTLWPSPKAGAGRRPGWSGPTYYGRPQLKAAPFNSWIVGAYIFLAGMSGSSSLIGAIAEGAGGARAKGVGRRARGLAVLAPTVGSALLIKDMHTPQRFYNMLRVFKPRSPMSIGTWILVPFGLTAVPSAIGHLLARYVPGFRWARAPSKLAQVPAAIAGAGLSFYTAALLASTSAPAWAAAPRALAIRFGASSMASAAAALTFGEGDPDVRNTLQLVAAGALATELVAARAQSAAYKAKSVEQVETGAWGKAEKLLATGLGVVAPLALFGASLAVGGRRGRQLGEAAAVLTLAGSALLRIATLGKGDESANRPEISLPFAQPENLPKPVAETTAAGAAKPGVRPGRRADLSLRRRIPGAQGSDGALTAAP